MTDDPDIQQKIADLEALRPSLGDIAVDAAIAALRGQATSIEQEVSGDSAVGIAGGAQDSPITTGDENTVGTARTRDNYGQTIGVVSNSTVQQFFGTATPGEDKETLLAAYLTSLTSECQQLRLSRLTSKQQTGADQSATPHLRLQAVYTGLTVNNNRDLGRKKMSGADLKKMLEEHNPDIVPPEKVRLLADVPDAIKHSFQDYSGRMPAQLDEISAGLPDDEVFEFGFTRPELATEAIRANHRLVLLGEPGAGKSTVLRYLSLLLALKEQGQPIDLVGWNDHQLPVPILCPLGGVAEVMRTKQPDPDKALWQSIGDVLDGEQSIRKGLRDHLTDAIRGGGVLLLFDGLDELPTSGDNPREKVAHALRRFAAGDGAETPIVVTCRVLPYQAEGDWKMRADEGWQTRIVQPLAFGQVRQFVQQWYAELTQVDHDLSSKMAADRTEKLLAALVENERLHPLVALPLLLTMLAILHYNREEIPRDRVKLYEECVQLLLDRWEPVRTPNLKKRPGLLERLGNLPNLELDMLRNILHRLAWQAHSEPPGADGRGLLDGPRLEGELLRFFNKRYPDHEPAKKVDTFIQVLNEDAGLLQARSDDRYAFPHLTFQEYLAACALADSDDLVRDAYAVWIGSDASRWREVLLLTAGRLRLLGVRSAQREGIPWLRHLLRAKLKGQEKTAIQRAQDAALAALSYRELGEQEVLDEEEIDDLLRDGIVALLETPDSGVVLADRVEAARMLGDLGDPRPGVCTLPPAMVRIEGGTFMMGGRDEAHSVSVSTFEIARYPITNAQYKRFIDDDGYNPARPWWDEAGRAWLQNKKVQQPRDWNDERFGIARPNYPVVGISWYEAVAFCRWLTQRLQDDYIYRLPTEAEWEYAARRDTRRTYPWGNEEPDGERANFNSIYNGTTAVGCFPLGATPDGIHDLAGNVWEWTGSIYRPYSYDATDGRENANDPAGSSFVRRGGGWAYRSITLRASIRLDASPDRRFSYLGFRPARHLPPNVRSVS
jgi:formylglycine-generating enzyme required for sulfatase activity/energy-coupling factor transporter ATP-binding protein EcfA2